MDFSQMGNFIIFSSSLCNILLCSFLWLKEGLDGIKPLFWIHVVSNEIILLVSVTPTDLTFPESTNHLLSAPLYRTSAIQNLQEAHLDHCVAKKFLQLFHIG